MIDLHSHILPGIDDGSPDLETSLEMARRSVADGISLMVATPHVNGRFMPDPASIRARVKELNDALAGEGIPLVVTTGAEIAISELGTLNNEDLASFALGGSKTLLVESPYTDGVPFFDEILFGAQSHGFRVLLAHPERSPMFQHRADVLRGLIDRGVLSSITAGSMRGRFGRTVQRYVADFFRLGLVHNVSSDTHDLRKRPPGLRAGFEGAERMVPGVTEAAPWLTEEVPTALLANQALPAPTAIEPDKSRTGNRLSRLFGD